MTTANQIIKQALGVLGVRAVGDSVAPNELAECLEQLNTLVDAWRTESLYAYARQTVTATLPGSTGSLTIGPTGDIEVDARPLRVDDAYFSSSGIDTPLASFTDEQFHGIAYKAIDGQPRGIYYEPNLPNGTLHFYPRSAGAVTLTLTLLVSISAFVDLTADYGLPPGYQNALVYNLAEALAPMYRTQLPPSAANLAAQARRNIKRVNHRVPQMMAYRPRGNILTGWEI